MTFPPLTGSPDGNPIHEVKSSSEGNPFMFVPISETMVYAVMILDFVDAALNKRQVMARPS